VQSANTPLRASIVETAEYRYAPMRLHVYQSIVVLIGCGVPGAIVVAGVGAAAGTAAGAAVAIPFLAAAIGGLRRAFRLELVAGRVGVSIRNFWRSWDLAWEDVADIGVGKQTLGFVPQSAVAFRTLTGQVARAQATPSTDSERDSMLSILRRLASPDTVLHPPRT